MTDENKKTIKFLQKHSGEILSNLIRDRDLLYQKKEDLEKAIKKLEIDLDRLFDFLKDNLMDKEI